MSDKSLRVKIQAVLDRTINDIIRLVREEDRKANPVVKPSFCQTPKKDPKAGNSTKQLPVQVKIYVRPDGRYEASTHTGVTLTRRRARDLKRSLRKLGYEPVFPSC
jgi:hypothetical protein